MSTPHSPSLAPDVGGSNFYLIRVATSELRRSAGTGPWTLDRGALTLPTQEDPKTIARTHSWSASVIAQRVSLSHTLQPQWTLSPTPNQQPSPPVPLLHKSPKIFIPARGTMHSLQDEIQDTEFNEKTARTARRFSPLSNSPRILRREDHHRLTRCTTDKAHFYYPSRKHSVARIAMVNRAASAGSMPLPLHNIDDIHEHDFALHSSSIPPESFLSPYAALGRALKAVEMSSQGDSARSTNGSPSVSTPSTAPSSPRL